MTVAAILEATLQILRGAGLAGATTTRIAERAGVSVGTLYQYFPNKSALLHAVLARHLEEVASAVEAASRAHRGACLAVAAEALAEAFLDAKTRDVAVSRALYAVASDLGAAELLDDVGRRIHAAVAALLGDVSDAAFADPQATAVVLRAVLAGTVRTTLEPRAGADATAIVRRELPTVCRTYLAGAALVRP